ncbi:MAG: tRNA (adenosine(37)-N6)-threonylcarbamoyltransferase complex ATPase subunit type 1 TsaE [Bacteroidota bacterium]|jgi:tRNA threonylcarbamoyladenosine biosynthesis protein TsaE
MTFLFHRSALSEAAQWLLGQIGTARVICFHGDMGAGKTTLIASICHQLGIEGTASSPTFPIIHEYGSAGESRSVYHMDWYRLNSADEAERAGVIDALCSGLYCLIEWPQKLPEIIPPGAIHVAIQVVDEDKRTLQLLNK